MLEWDFSKNLRHLFYKVIKCVGSLIDPTNSRKNFADLMIIGGAISSNL